MKKWNEIDLFDPDGGQPDEEKKRELLLGYKTSGSIDGYFFIDPTAPAVDEDNQGELYPDPYALAHAWEIMPKADQIDWEGIEENN